LISKGAKDAKEIFHYLNELMSSRGTSNAQKEHLSLLCSTNQETYEVVSKIVNKDAKSGFSAKLINKAEPGLIYIMPYMRCMGEKDIDRIQYPAFAQEKADGVFVNVTVNPCPSILFQTRNGKTIHQLDHLKDILIHNCMRGIVMMGELLVKRKGKILPRKTGNGIINSCLNGTCDEKDAKNVVLRVWDVVPIIDFKKHECKIPYIKRISKCRSIVRDINNKELFDLIETRRVKSSREAIDFYKEIRKQGKEGTIEKNDNGIWKFHTSPDCIKRKNVSDCELRIERPVYGKGMKNRHTLGALECISEDGLVQVSVGVGITDKDRDKGMGYWLEQIGKVVTVEFESVISNKTDMNKYSLYLPRFPKESDYIQIREDRTYADSYKEIISRSKSKVVK
jgi:hypothetical protein